MKNDEFKETMEEVYKYLREKIITMYGEFLSEEDKKLLYSFDTENSIIIESTSKNPIEYDASEGKIIISDGFINKENIDRIKSKNSFDLEVLKGKIEDNYYNINTEELILFSGELNIKEKDIIKSLYTQEILKMILMLDEMSIKEKVIMESAIEVFSHKLGVEQGFIVSTHKNMINVLEIGVALKEIFKDKFDKLIFSKNPEELINELGDENLIKNINKITNERTILESTQNLDEVVDSINEVVKEVDQVLVVDTENNKIIKFIDENGNENLYETDNIDLFIKVYNSLKVGNKIVTTEELLKTLNENDLNVSLYKDNIELSHIGDENKYDNSKMVINKEEGLFVKEAIVKIDNIGPMDRMDESEYNELDKRFATNSNSLTEEELKRMDKYIASDKTLENLKIGKTGRRKIFIMALIIILTIASGILVGWLLFKFK